MPPYFFLKKSLRSLLLLEKKSTPPYFFCKKSQPPFFYFFQKQTYAKSWKWVTWPDINYFLIFKNNFNKWYLGFSNFGLKKSSPPNFFRKKVFVHQIFFEKGSWNSSLTIPVFFADSLSTTQNKQIKMKHFYNMVYHMRHFEEI